MTLPESNRFHDIQDKPSKPATHKPKLNGFAIIAGSANSLHNSPAEINAKPTHTQNTDLQALQKGIAEAKPTPESGPTDTSHKPNSAKITDTSTTNLELQLAGDTGTFVMPTENIAHGGHIGRVANDITDGLVKEVDDHPVQLAKDVVKGAVIGGIAVTATIGLAAAGVAAAPFVVVGGAAVLAAGEIYEHRQAIFHGAQVLGHSIATEYNHNGTTETQQEKAKAQLEHFGGSLARVGATMLGGGLVADAGAGTVAAFSATSTTEGTIATATAASEGAVLTANTAGESAMATAGVAGESGQVIVGQSAAADETDGSIAEKALEQAKRSKEYAKAFNNKPSHVNTHRPIIDPNQIDDVNTHSKFNKANTSALT